MPRVNNRVIPTIPVRISFYVAMAMVLFCTSIAHAASIGLTVLPKNEHEAAIMLAEGQLDSSLWRVLEPYYTQPINVPDGELRFLEAQADLPAQNVPTSKEQLAVYEPWSKKDQQRFFSDYPSLLILEPILSFKKSKKKLGSNFNTGLYTDNEKASFAQAGFTLRPMPQVLLYGTSTLYDSTLLWRKRLVSISTKQHVTLSAGTIQPVQSNDLFFGYFPDESKNQDTRDNWLYGSSQTWNGVSAEATIADRIGVNAVFHKRKSEEIMAASGCFAFQPGVMGMLVASKVIGYDSGGTQASQNQYIQATFSGKAKGMSASLYTGITTKTPAAIPFCVEINRKTQGSLFAVRVAQLPGSMSLAMSKLAWFAKRSIDIPDSVHTDMTFVECRTGIALLKDMETGLNLRTVLSGYDNAFTGVVNVSGHLFLDIHGAYGLNGTSRNNVESQYVSALLAKQLGQNMSLSFSGRYTAKSQGVQSVFLRLPFTWQALEVLTISPFCTYYATNSKLQSASLGCKQTLFCFDRTWCELQLETSRDTNNKQDWNVHVRAQFVF